VSMTFPVNRLPSSGSQRDAVAKGIIYSDFVGSGIETTGQPQNKILDQLIGTEIVNRICS